MRGCVEILSGVIRVGSGCNKYAAPFELSAAFSVDGDVATVKALVADQEHKLTFSHYRAAKRAQERLGLKMRWVRFNQKQQTEDVIMSKIHDPAHPHHLPPIPPGYVIAPDDPLYIKASDLHAKGHLTFTVLSETPLNDDDDLILIRRRHVG